MTTTDRTGGNPEGQSPATVAVTVTASDSADVDGGFFRAFRVGSTAGDVKITTFDGSTVVIPNVQIGELIPVAVKRIWATGTAATGITGFR